MELDRHGFETLDRAQCLDLLRTRSVGRVAITVAALPAIFPVAFTMLGDDIVFRSPAGSKLTAAARRAVVAFEAGDVDAVRDAGWSVLIVGQAIEITASADVDRALWPDGHAIRIRSELVSGRHFGAWAGSPHEASPTMSPRFG